MSSDCILALVVPQVHEICIRDDLQRSFDGWLITAMHHNTVKILSSNAFIPQIYVNGLAWSSSTDLLAVIAEHKSVVEGRGYCTVPPQTLPAIMLHEELPAVVERHKTVVRRARGVVCHLIPPLSVSCSTSMSFSSAV